MKVPILNWMPEVTDWIPGWDNRSAVQTPEILLIFLKKVISTGLKTTFMAFEILRFYLF